MAVRAKLAGADAAANRHRLDPGSLGGSAWEAAITSFVLFALGAIVPVIPFIFLQGMAAVAVSVAMSAVGLFVIGSGITLFTGRSVLFSGARQVLFGLAAAALTSGVWRLIGVNLGGRAGASLKAQTRPDVTSAIIGHDPGRYRLARSQCRTPSRAHARELALPLYPPQRQL
jgi:hypothetical protein